MKPKLLALFGAVAVLAAPACAAERAGARLAPPFGEGMVLQRDKPLSLWGSAQPGDTLRLTLGRRQVRVQVGRDGRWRAHLPPQPAAGPLRLRLRDSAGRLHADWSDVWLGDVWICAGQSNMAWPLARSLGAEAALQVDAPRLRHWQAGLRASLQVQPELAPAPWVRSRPGAAGDFSAVGWHFARKLQAAEPQVAIGLLNIAWGGSMLESWLSPAAARRDPDLSAALERLPADDAHFMAQRSAAVQARVAAFQPGLPVQAVNGADAALPDADWPLLRVPGLWEPQGLADVDGSVWLRREVMLSAAQAGAPAWLSLGTLDDCDDSHVNGQRVGGLCGYDQPRRHAVPVGLLREGRNLIAVRVTDHGQGGGFSGDPARLQLETAAGSVPLAGPWRARVEALQHGAQPTANDGVSLAHNGMLAPLRGLAVRGVIWYQGESNVDRAAAYAAHFRALIDDWRAHLQDPALPFLFVQLAAFRPLALNDANRSPWAELRESQAAALSLPGTGMALALDVGDADDIHPRDKRTVGERLARWVLGQPAASARLLAAQREGRALRLRFDRPLRLRAGAVAVQGFHIAQGEGGFVPATARLVGDSVWLEHPLLQNPDAARYAWVDNPGEANLMDVDGMPLAPLRTDRRPRVTEAARFGR